MPVCTVSAACICCRPPTGSTHHVCQACTTSAASIPPSRCTLIYTVSPAYHIHARGRRAGPARLRLRCTLHRLQLPAHCCHRHCIHLCSLLQRTWPCVCTTQRTAALLRGAGCDGTCHAQCKCLLGHDCSLAAARSCIAVDSRYWICPAHAQHIALFLVQSNGVVLQDWSLYRTTWVRAWVRQG